ncbi:MAG: amino acid-binding protein, partial [Rhodococcus sp. (in: high G+C Gram-positive bacteria)]
MVSDGGRRYSRVYLVVKGTHVSYLLRVQLP